MLLNAEPSGGRQQPDRAPLLEVDDLKVWFPIKKGFCATPSITSRRWTASTSACRRADPGHRRRKRLGQIHPGPGDLRLIASKGGIRFQGQQLEG
jgi:microcin C transport system ATP-binding protein